MSSVLVTGASGFIGARVVEALRANGEDVTAVVRPGGSTRRLSAAGIPVRPVDLRDRAGFVALLREVRPQAVVHLAWYAAPADYLTSPLNVESLETTLSTMKDALSAGCRKIVGVGTCLEYARSDQLRSEGDPCAPESLYAACKHAAFTAGKAMAAAAGAEFAWARVFHIHGPDEDPGRLLPRVISALRSGTAFPLTSGEQVRDHLHVADVGRAIALLLRPGIDGPVNICSGQPIRLRDLLLEVAALTGRPDLLLFGQLPDRAGEQRFLAGRPTSLEKAGFRPTFTLAAGLRDAVRGTSA